MIYVILGIVLAVVLWIVLTYNALIRTRQHVRESWSGIDTELKRRYDLVPNLVETVRGYAAHERELFESVTKARAQAEQSTGSPEAQAADENVLVAGMQRLLAVAEDYPALKASAHYLALQEELANTENRIQAARRFYNANVRDLNTRLEVFPSNLIGSAFSFRPEEYFEVESPVIRKVVDVNFSGPN